MERTIMIPKTVAVFGAGLAAQALIDAGVHIDNHYELISGARGLIEVELFDGVNCTVARNGDHGLSAKYHGVTPSDVITDRHYFSALMKLKLFCPNEDLRHYGYFVPKIVPRPTINNLNFIPPGCVSDYLREKNYFCMSVLGNLLALQKFGYIGTHINVSDDVIFKLGTLDAKDIKVQTKRIKTGTFFPAKYFQNTMIYFRPVYLQEVDIDFSKRLFNLKGVEAKVFFEKILCSLYLKYGVHILHPIKWEIFAQHNLKEAYIVEKGTISANPHALRNINLAKLALERIVCADYPNLQRSKFKYFNGIHLSYDRSLLNKVPKEIDVLDTSLSRSSGYHPSIEMYCKVYNKYAE